MMTRLLFLPNDQTFLWLDSDQPADEVVEAVLAGYWAPPEPYGTALAELSQEQPLNAFRQGSLVVITTTRPLNIKSKAVATVSTVQPAGLMLTPRQHDVLQCLAEGLTTKQIALRLGLRPRTIAMHVAALKQRLGTTTRAQSVGRAAALGLCKPGNFTQPRPGV